MEKTQQAPRGAPVVDFKNERLLHVCRDEFRHLEHGDLAFAAKKRLELVICQDVALVGRILEVVRLDVDPDLLHDLSAGHRPLADDCLKLRSEIERL